MKRFKSVFVKFMAFAAVTFSQQIFASGGMETGGGKGVLCTYSLRTLEIYEAEEIHGLPFVLRYPALYDNLMNYGAPLAVYWSYLPADANDPSLQKQVLKEVSDNVITLFRDIPFGTTLPFTNDATLPPIPNDCSFVQIATFDDAKNVIHRDPVLWNKMDAYNQAALIFHEGYYHSARVLHATTSDETRRMIGLAMSNQLPEPRWKPFWNATDHLICVGLDKSGKTIYQFRGRDEVQNGVRGVALYAEIFETHMSHFRTVAFLSGVKVQDFKGAVTKSWSTTIRNQFSNEIWNFELSLSSGFGKMRAWSPGQPAPAFSTGLCQVEKWPGRIQGSNATPTFTGPVNVYCASTNSVRTEFRQ